MADFEFLHTLPSGTILEILQGDITKMDTDAIINAANSQLMHGGGVAATIARQGGEVIQKESRQWVHEHGPVTHSHPAFTSGGNLQCRYVIHAVGPVWGEGDEDRKLNETITGCLVLAQQLVLCSLAFPAISTGIFCFPLNRAANIFANALFSFFSRSEASSLKHIYLVLFDQAAHTAFLAAFNHFFSTKR